MKTNTIVKQNYLPVIVRDTANLDAGVQIPSELLSDLHNWEGDEMFDDKTLTGEISLPFMSTVTVIGEMRKRNNGLIMEPAKKNSKSLFYLFSKYNKTDLVKLTEQQDMQLLELKFLGYTCSLVGVGLLAFGGLLRYNKKRK